MKADQFGTWTEQIMFRIGYKTSKERQAAGLFGNKCSNCEHIGHRTGFDRVRCLKNDLATTINATCNEWQEKKAPA